MELSVEARLKSGASIPLREEVPGSAPDDEVCGLLIHFNNVEELFGVFVDVAGGHVLVSRRTKREEDEE
jgi:hypothetical protein